MDAEIEKRKKNKEECEANLMHWELHPTYVSPKAFAPTVRRYRSAPAEFCHTPNSAAARWSNPPKGSVLKNDGSNRKTSDQNFSRTLHSTYVPPKQFAPSKREMSAPAKLCHPFKSAPRDL